MSSPAPASDGDAPLIPETPLTSHTNSTQDTPDPNNPHKANTTKYFAFYPLLDPGMFEAFDGAAIFGTTALNKHRISDNLASKIIIWATIHKKPKYGFMARNYFVTSGNNVRKRGKVIGFGSPFIYEGKFKVGIAAGDAWSIIELCEKQEFVDWFHRICDGRFAMFTPDILKKYPAILKTSLGSVVPTANPFLAEAALVKKALAGPTPLGDHTPPPQAPLPPSDQTPTPAPLPAPHDRTPLIRAGLPANDNGLAGSPPHTTKTQMVRPRPVNPAHQSAPAKLASATIPGLHLLSRPPPVFDPAGICAPFSLPFRHPMRYDNPEEFDSEFSHVEYERTPSPFIKGEDYDPLLFGAPAWKAPQTDSSEEYEPKLEYDSEYDPEFMEQVQQQPVQEPAQQQDPAQQQQPVQGPTQELAQQQEPAQEHQQESEQDQRRKAKEQDDKLRSFGTMRAGCPKNPTYEYHSISTTLFDPSKTYTETPPFVNNTNFKGPNLDFPLPPPSDTDSTPRPRDPSPMKGVRTTITASDGTVSSVYGEDEDEETGKASEISYDGDLEIGPEDAEISFEDEKEIHPDEAVDNHILSSNDSDYRIPFGGGKQSGIGRELGGG
ncbi:hypothetical protein VE01_04082 [Pseudogymnoascus verrucosus]|uniref:SANTA domain-containing protein n=1 Tax=Pseudogymnoascus verrucosus TaxID=342668 RepID=A0A1B8GLW8_9PEZI|nr:uncharacterized protein VE01_04082 [Pseudogymnoascus verrucosus]OBT96830.2 hypothetical protein VE01_04082 [Pseudogymnoascus verrucosus]